VKKGKSKDMTIYTTKTKEVKRERRTLRPKGKSRGKKRIWMEFCKRGGGGTMVVETV